MTGKGKDGKKAEKGKTKRIKKNDFSKTQSV
jgi:hypothetical protein